MAFVRSAAAIERCLDSGLRCLLSHSRKLPSVAQITYREYATELLIFFVNVESPPIRNVFLCGKN
jgi:hypothetical protein